MALINLKSLINTPTFFQSEKTSYLFNSYKQFLQKFQNVRSYNSQYIQGNPKIKFNRGYKSFKFESINNELNE